MKFLQKNALCVAAALGCIGAAFHLWVLSAGTDAGGLYPADHPGWIGYIVLSGLAVLLFLLLNHDPAHRLPSPAPVPAQIGRYVAAVGVLIYAFSVLKSNAFFDFLVGLVGVAAALALIFPLFFSKRRKMSLALCYALPCVFFTLEMFRYCLRNSGEPELIRFIPQQLALIACALAFYQFWGTAVGLDTGKKRGFWQCLAGYLCLAAAPGEHPVFALVAICILIGPGEIAPPSSCETAEPKASEDPESGSASVG